MAATYSTAAGDDGGTWPLQAIAAKSGYQNEYAFSRAFKREFATAPSIYRRNHHTADKGP